MQKADLAILLSDYEKRCLEHLGALGDMPHHIVKTVEIGGLLLAMLLLPMVTFFKLAGWVRKPALAGGVCLAGVKVLTVSGATRPSVAQSPVMIVFLGRIGHDNPLFGALIQNSAAVCLQLVRGRAYVGSKAASCDANIYKLALVRA